MALCLRFCCLILALAGEPTDWGSLSLRIQEDSSVSSDTATLCRVQVVNSGQGTWEGRGIVFEARALRDGRVAARVLGRFGGTLGPRETLETAVGFTGRFQRFEVSASTGRSDGASGRPRSRGQRRAGGTRKKPARRN